MTLISAKNRADLSSISAEQSGPVFLAHPVYLPDVLNDDAAVLIPETNTWSVAVSILQRVRDGGRPAKVTNTMMMYAYKKLHNHTEHREVAIGQVSLLLMFRKLTAVSSIYIQGGPKTGPLCIFLNIRKLPKIITWLLAHIEVSVY